MSVAIPEEGRRRVVMEGVSPSIDHGRFPIKRIVGDEVVVEADIFADGHDLVAARLRFRHTEEEEWCESQMTPLVNDRWRGRFSVERIGRYCYTLTAWIDHFATWRRDLKRRVDPADIEVALVMGARELEAAAWRATGEDSALLAGYAMRLTDISVDPATRRDIALEDRLGHLMSRHAERRFATNLGYMLEVVVERERARFSAWYEMFPRSCTPEAGRHGTFRDAEARLPYVAAMGFDVLYLPPIHPIGESRRKGRNNLLVPQPGDPGSPWAIGAASGGHREVHPELGTLDDFRRLLGSAAALGIEVAIDLALQCSPDHPYVTQHPEWFLHRPDGTVQYAENPPKKYQDIYPFHFEGEAWRELWEEVERVVEFWVGQGITIFRVDNPHTKPFGLWEWLITQVKERHPEVLFLAEAFSRPKVMYRLAKLGFSQSYTYFTWRNTRWELEQYMTELTRGEPKEFFRPNFWPNTPDILPEYLQFGGRPAFVARLILAATLSSSYGIYGPAFELLEREPREPGSEEYRDSEKYEVRHWEIDRLDSLRELIARLNRIRREHRALQSNDSLSFHAVDNGEILCFSKSSPDLSELVLTIVNLDPYHVQSGWVTLPLESLGIEPHRPYQLHDLLTGARHLWHGERNYVEIDPASVPAQIFRVRRHIRTEHDFEYFF